MALLRVRTFRSINQLATVHQHFTKQCLYQQRIYYINTFALLQSAQSIDYLCVVQCCQVNTMSARHGCAVASGLSASAMPIRGCHAQHPFLCVWSVH